MQLVNEAICRELDQERDGVFFFGDPINDDDDDDGDKEEKEEEEEEATTIVSKEEGKRRKKTTKKPDKLPKKASGRGYEETERRRGVFEEREHPEEAG
mmetsp:Transcript_20866/g.31468  ORF Transcript_20866/g.31468 Transcript_20866/m.31468 type:complete len:98 (+) Transcript_20866:78-371(+)